MSKKALTYESALAEIEQIVQNIENNKYSIDQLSDKVKRITELVNYCREKIKVTEEELVKIIQENKKEETDFESTNKNI